MAALYICLYTTVLSDRRTAIYTCRDFDERVHAERASFVLNLSC